MPRSQRAYKPDPKHVSVGTTQAGWSIELCSDATVVELALLMTAFRCRAELVTEDLLRLTPMSPDLPCPTGEEIRDLFEHGEVSLKRIGPIRIAPSIAPVIEFDVNLVCTCGAPGGYPHEPDCTWWEAQIDPIRPEEWIEIGHVAVKCKSVAKAARIAAQVTQSRQIGIIEGTLFMDLGRFRERVGGPT